MATETRPYKRVMRKELDYIIVAHYWYNDADGHRGYLKVSDTYGLPVSTVRAMIRRIDRNHPRVRRIAIDSGWLNLFAKKPLLDLSLE